MYDLNLSVPNISATKYSDDEKFYLLKNYLYELNETLSYALSNVDSSNLSNGFDDNPYHEVIPISFLTSP